MSKEREDKPILEGVADSVKTKRDLLLNNIRSKSMIEDYLHGKLKKEELAYALAEDKELRKTTERVVEGIINPEPVNVFKEERDAVALDFGYGLSVFWKEINTPIDQKVNAAADVRDVLDQVNVAADPMEPPKIREELYRDLGMDDEKINTLIPESEKVNYVKALEDHSNFDCQQEPVNGYVEEYGMTPEELNRVYGDARGDDVYNYPPYDQMDRLAEYPTMSRAIKNIEAVYAGSLEDNKISLYELESTEASISKAGFSEDDLKDLNEEYLKHLANNTPPNLTDDDLADLDMKDKDLQI